MFTCAQVAVDIDGYGAQTKSARESIEGVLIEHTVHFIFVNKPDVLDTF